MARNVIAKLAKVLPLPKAPCDTDPKMLARNEGILRIQFPKDFVDFGKQYGSGTIKSAYSWEVWSPFRPTYPLIVMEFARTWNIYRDSVGGTDVPFGIFPEVGGVLPFATTDGGDWVCWRTEGDPDKWTVVDLCKYDNGYYELLNMSFSEYFLAVLTRKTVLIRHQHGQEWDPKADLIFSSKRVFFDQNY
jgi:hypothetical protein